MKQGTTAFSLSERQTLLSELAAFCLNKGVSLSTAESCTGGLIAGAMTDIAGSSAWFDRGFVTYSNEAKMDMLGVTQNQLDQHGAVSAAVVEAMAQGAVARSLAQFSVSVSGVAGPGGGTEDKPVGTVWFGLSNGDITASERRHFDGDRADVRQQTIDYALASLFKFVQKNIN